MNTRTLARTVRRALKASMVALALAGAVAAVPTADAVAQDNPTRPGAPRPPAPVSGKVSVEVLAVYATTTHNRVDPALRDIVDDLRRMRGYTGFELVETERASLGVGQETTFTVTGNKKVKVRLNSRNDQKATVRMRVFSGDKMILDVTSTLTRNRTIILAGPSYRDGDLLLPISVRY